jgi:hypothetical protein
LSLKENAGKMPAGGHTKILVASLCILLAFEGFLLSSHMAIGAAVHSSSSDSKKVAQWKDAAANVGQADITVTFGIPDFQSMRVPVTVWMDVRFAENYSQPGILVFGESPSELPLFLLNRTSPTHVNGQESGIAYLSGSREAFPSDSYVAIVKIHISEGGLNFTSRTTGWYVPGFKESDSHWKISQIGYTTNVEIEETIERDPQWLLPVILVMICSPLAILAAIPFASADDQDVFSHGLATIQPRIVLAFTLVTASLTLFEVFRTMAGTVGFFTFPEVISIATIFGGGVYIVGTLAWFTKHGKLAYYDLLSSLLSAGIIFYLLDRLTSYIETFNPPEAVQALQNSISFVRLMQLLIPISVLFPAVLQTVRKIGRTPLCTEPEKMEGEYVC